MLLTVTCLQTVLEVSSDTCSVHVKSTFLGTGTKIPTTSTTQTCNSTGKTEKALQASHTAHPVWPAHPRVGAATCVPESPPSNTAEGLAPGPAPRSPLCPAWHLSTMLGTERAVQPGAPSPGLPRPLHRGPWSRRPHLHAQADGVEHDEGEHQVLEVGGGDDVPHLVLVGVLGDVAPQGPGLQGVLHALALRQEHWAGQRWGLAHAHACAPADTPTHAHTQPAPTPLAGGSCPPQTKGSCGLCWAVQGRVPPRLWFLWRRQCPCLGALGITTGPQRPPPDHRVPLRVGAGLGEGPCPWPEPQPGGGGPAPGSCPARSSCTQSPPAPGR